MLAKEVETIIKEKSRATSGIWSARVCTVMVALLCPSVKTMVSEVVTKMEVSGGEISHVRVTVPTVPALLNTSTMSSFPSSIMSP